MNRRDVRTVAGAAVLAAMVVGGFAAAAVVSDTGAAATSATPAKVGGAVHLRIDLQRFQYVHAQRRLVAHGRVVATYRRDGHTQGTTVRSVLMRVQQGTTCRVLHLELGELRLNLLGLIVSLTPVDDPSIVLDISADSSEALGKLLCQVISSVQNGTLAKTKTTTRRLNAVVQKQYGGGVLSLDVPLSGSYGQQGTTDTATTTTSTTATATTTTTTTTTSAGQCEVLNLVLGPLNLDLLGLIVQLNKVQLDISANPTGTLGTLFCQVAGTTLTAPTGITTAITGLTGTTATTATTTTTTTP